MKIVKIVFDFERLAHFFSTLPVETKLCRLCKGEPFVKWEDKDRPRTIGATHHTCHEDEELMTLAKKYENDKCADCGRPMQPQRIHEHWCDKVNP